MEPRKHSSIRIETLPKDPVLLDQDRVFYTRDGGFVMQVRKWEVDTFQNTVTVFLPDNITVVLRDKDAFNFLNIVRDKHAAHFQNPGRAPN